MLVNTCTCIQHHIKKSMLICVCQSAPAPPRKTRAELFKDIDADYYGYRDEDDGVLVPLEQEVESEGKLPRKRTCEKLSSRLQ